MGRFMKISYANMHARADLPEGLAEYIECLLHLLRVANMSDHDDAYDWQLLNDAGTHYNRISPILHDVAGEEVIDYYLDTDIWDWLKVDHTKRYTPEKWEQLNKTYAQIYLGKEKD